MMYHAGHSQILDLHSCSTLAKNVIHLPKMQQPYPKCKESCSRCNHMTTFLNICFVFLRIYIKQVFLHGYMLSCALTHEMELKQIIKQIAI